MSFLTTQIQHENLRRLYRYWEARRQGDAFPARRDLDPIEIPYVLGDILLLDVLRDPLRFRFRLHGANMVRRAGYDMTGKLVDELPGSENRAHLLARCRSLVQRPRPLSAVSDRFVDSRTWRYEVLWLPLANDGVSVDMLMGTLIYINTPR